MKKVKPDTARKGEYIESFEVYDTPERHIRETCASMESLLKARKKKGEIVYTLIGEGKPGATWQIYWLRG